MQQQRIRKFPNSMNKTARLTCEPSKFGCDCNDSLSTYGLITSTANELMHGNITQTEKYMYIIHIYIQIYMSETDQKSTDSLFVIS